MAYADQQMSGNRIIALIIVGLIHVALGYALVTGLAYEAANTAAERLTTVDIEEPPPPEPENEPPPPEPQPDMAPPPPVAPPPPISIAPAPPQIRTQPTIPPPAPPVLRVPPAAAPPGPPPAPPPPPPPPRVAPKAAEPRGNPGTWATPNDYPSRALREEREGTTGFRVTVSADGRVESCSVTRSSGHSDLDDATCKNIQRRGRFRPATDGNGDAVSGSWSSQVRWQIPD